MGTRTVAVALAFDPLTASAILTVRTEVVAPTLTGDAEYAMTGARTAQVETAFTPLIES